MAIRFILHEVSIKIPDRSRLKLYIKELFKREQKQLAALTYIFCTDKYLLTINREFLRHDDYTDIITFCLSEDHSPIEGEVYISVDRIRENARLLAVPINEELHRVIFHGALHLCGYKDKSSSTKRKMTLAEDRNLKLYFS